MPVIDSFTKTTAKNLQLLGINVVIKNTTWSEMAQQRAIKSTEGKKTWNIFHSFWAASDISNSNSILFSTDPNNGWFGWPNNIAIELLREAYTFASNENERFAIRDKVRQYSKYETNYIPLGQFFLPVAYRSRVHGVVDASAQFYWTVELDD
jgi:peptide/nickel transport system substrate-binding protein